MAEEPNSSSKNGVSPGVRVKFFSLNRNLSKGMKILANENVEKVFIYRFSFIPEKSNDLDKRQSS